MASIRILLLLLIISAISASASTIDKEKLRWMRKKPVIDSIVIEGNSYFSDSDIRHQMYSKIKTLWRTLKRDRRSRLQKETYRRDTLEIKYLYIINGFLGVRVDETFNVQKKDSSVLVRVMIDEGDQFFYGDKSITGSYEKRFDNRFRKIIKELKEGKPVNPFELRKSVFDLRTVLANNGYPYAAITYFLDTNSSHSHVPVVFSVKSDSLVHFGEVAIEGLEHYPEYVARREIKIKPDKLYKRKTILESQRRLFESGYFSFLQLNQVENGGERLKPNFILKARERKPKYFSLTTGAGQSEVKDLIWDFSFGFGKRNFFESRKINLLADYSFSVGKDSRLIAHRYRVRYTEPWFLGIRMPLMLTGEFEPPIRSLLQDFKIRTWSLSMSTSKWYGENIRTTTGLEYVRVKISGVPPEKKDSLRLVEGISVRRKTYFTFRNDSRDNIFIPRRGILTDFSSEYFGGFLGGADNFYKIKASLAAYRVIWPGWISATRIKGGWVQEFGVSDEAPKEELLYLGGANTI
ncbi:MAG: outer membrane protein assembly factor, partial [Candidatus Zixiibacteriota bacterium]